MPQYHDGQVAVNAQGVRKVYNAATDTWTLAPAAPGSPVVGRQLGRLSVQDQKTLNDLNTQAASAGETRRIYDQAQGAVHRLETGPFRGAMLDAAIPSEKGGFLDKLGSLVIGAPLRLAGAITPQNVTDYQLLDSLKQERVGARQVEQKGPQTEADAARYMLADISPYKTEDANKLVNDRGTGKAARAQARARFYTSWANHYGLNGLNPAGEAVEAAFQAELKRQKDRLDGAAATGQGWKFLGPEQ